MRRYGGPAAGLVVAALLTVLSGGCDKGAAAAPTEPPPRTYAASAAGGACQLLDFAVINETLGVTFDIAGAASKDHTFTCAITKAGSTYPDLTFSLAATGSDPTIYKQALVPKSATSVSGLGKVAYRTTSAASGQRGPRVEVGWLAGEKAMVLRYTFAKDATAEDATTLTPKLVALAKKIAFANI
ncbi:hypothetical protein [Luedemannella helvata]|uniref:DUF3558 domain-containing protein n=1 Tax=Luedemannella helvata TaxID=349315 RepID=A0ABP4WWX2_9ACTN